MALFRVETRVQMDFRKSNQVSPQVERKVARNRGVEFNFRPVGGQRAKKNERDGHKVELQFEYDETIRKNDQDPRNRIILYRRWQSKGILIIFIGNKR